MQLQTNLSNDSMNKTLFDKFHPYLRAHVGADPLQPAVVPDLVQILGFKPPDTRYPSKQE